MLVDYAYESVRVAALVYLRGRLRHNVVAAILGLYVHMRFLPFWQLYEFSIDGLVRDHTEQMRNAV